MVKIQDYFLLLKILANHEEMISEQIPTSG